MGELNVFFNPDHHPFYPVPPALLANSWTAISTVGLAGRCYPIEPSPGTPLPWIEPRCVRSMLFPDIIISADAPICTSSAGCQRTIRHGRRARTPSSVSRRNASGASLSTYAGSEQPRKTGPTSFRHFTVRLPSELVSSDSPIQSFLNTLRSRHRRSSQSQRLGPQLYRLKSLTDASKRPDRFNSRPRAPRHGASGSQSLRRVRPSKGPDLRDRHAFPLASLLTLAYLPISSAGARSRIPENL